MAIRRPVTILGTGRRFYRGLPEVGEMPTAIEREAVRAGAVPVVVEAFVEFDDGGGYQRWNLIQGFFVIREGDHATSALIEGGQMDLNGNDDPVPELQIAEMKVSRWQAAAAPRRLELDPALARELKIE